MPATLEITDGNEVHTLDCSAERPTDGQRRVNFLVLEEQDKVTEMSVDAVLLGKPFVHDQLNQEDKAQAESALQRAMPRIREQLHEAYHGTEPLVDFLKKSRIRVEGTSPEAPEVHIEPGPGITY